MPDEELEARPWYYGGRRLGKSNKVLHLWVDHKEEEHWYADAPSSAGIGRRYDVRCTADGGQAVTKSARLDYGEQELHGKTNEWRLEDRAASAEIERIRATKRAAADNGDLGDLTLSDVRALLNKGPWSQRAGYLAAVLRYLDA